jgi:hydroxypyruvate isomerase
MVKTEDTIYVTSSNAGEALPERITPFDQVIMPMKSFDAPQQQELKAEEPVTHSEIERFPMTEFSQFVKWKAAHKKSDNETISETISEEASLTESAGGMIQEGVELIKTKASGFVESAKSTIEQAHIPERFTSAMQTATNTINSATDTINTTMNATIETTKETISQAHIPERFNSAMQTATNTINNTVNATTETINQAHIPEKISSATNTASHIVDSVVQTAQTTTEVIASTILSAKETIQEAHIPEKLSAATHTASEFVGSTIESVKHTVQDAHITERLNQATESALDKFDALMLDEDEYSKLKQLPTQTEVKLPLHETEITHMGEGKFVQTQLQLEHNLGLEKKEM